MNAPKFEGTKTIQILLSTLALLCFGLLPKAQGVIPAPDGGYPGANTAEGQNALLSLTAGHHDTAVGFFSLRSDATGSYNTAIGAGALLSNTADSNTATGFGALLSNTTGANNTADGTLALFSNNTASTAIGNTAIGSGALFSNTTGGANTATGVNALVNNTTGEQNTAIGAFALERNTTGLSNTAVGYLALDNSTGSQNIALGLLAGHHVTTASDVICIGTGGADVDNTCFIGNIRGVTTVNNDAVPVLIDSAGQLGTASSSRRYKTEIKPMGKASESILALNPVSFRYKVHKDTTPQFGLIAEDVAKVNPDLVVREGNGDIYTVRYDAVNAMLLNEFLKEHRKVQELEANDAEQQREIKALAAAVKEQAARIQKVSAELEFSKRPPQIVLTNRLKSCPAPNEFIGRLSGEALHEN